MLLKNPGTLGVGDTHLESKLTTWNCVNVSVMDNQTSLELDLRSLLLSSHNCMFQDLLFSWRLKLGVERSE